MRPSSVGIAALAWLLSGHAAGAASIGDAVPGHPGVRYFDLMKFVVTDLAPTAAGGAAGSEVADFRHIEGKDSKTDTPDGISIGDVDALPIPGDTSRIMLLADLGRSEGYVAEVDLLSLFSLSPTLQLLDVVEVGNDKFTAFGGSAVPTLLAPRTPLILIESGHDNSNQSYVLTEMIFVRGNRFEFIDSVPTFGDAYCAFRRTQTPSFATRTEAEPYRAIEVAVREHVTVSGEDCGGDKPPRAGTRTFRATYRWNARRRRFETTSRAFRLLAAENEKRF